MRSNLNQSLRFRPVPENTPSTLAPSQADPYLDSALLAEIETYHEASVIAHQEYRIPDVRLPLIGSSSTVTE